MEKAASGRLCCWSSKDEKTPTSASVQSGRQHAQDLIQRPHCVHNRLPDFDAVNLVVRPDQFQRFPLHELVFGLATLWRFVPAFGPGRLRGHLVEEVGNSHVEHPGKLMELTGTNLIVAAFIFMDLLGCQADRLGYRLLRHPQKNPALPQARADLHVDRMIRHDTPNLACSPSPEAPYNESLRPDHAAT